MVLPLEGVVVRFDLPLDVYRRLVVSEVLLATALQRRMGKPVRFPHRFAGAVSANCLSDISAGGERASKRVVAMKLHQVTTGEISRAANQLPINVVVDYLVHNQVRRAPGMPFHTDHRGLVLEEHRTVVARALSELLGIEHAPDPACDCRTCAWAATGDWEQLFDWQQVRPCVARELYEQAVLLGYPRLEQSTPLTVSWQPPAETTRQRSTPVTPSSQPPAETTAMQRHYDEF